MMGRALLTTVFTLAFATGMAQVRVDRPIVLTGTDDGARQVLGLPSASSPWHLLDAATEQDGTHRFVAMDEGPSWSVEVAGLAGPPVAGTALMLAPGSLPKGPLFLTVNGAGPFALTWGGHTPFHGADANGAAILSLVFDGEGFQVLNGQLHQRRECPDDMVAVNDHYCIDLLEHDLTDWYTAAMTCAQENKRLCSWGEFYVACVNSAELGVPDLSGNGEWTNSSANFTPAFRIVGPACGTVGVGLPDGPPRAYHCCLDR